MIVLKARRRRSRAKSKLEGAVRESGGILLVCKYVV